VCRSGTGLPTGDKLDSEWKGPYYLGLPLFG
jgi:hypothetical protein